MKSKTILFVIILRIFCFSQLIYAVERNNFNTYPSITSSLTISGNLINIMNGSTIPSEIDNTLFSSTQVAGEVKFLSYFIVNDGTSDLIISSLQINGANASDFQIMISPTSTIAAGDVSFFTIAFDPSAVGERNASIEVISNDDVNPIFTFAIQGKGLNYIECGFNLINEIVAIQDFEPTTNPLSWGYSISYGLASVLGGTAYAENSSPVVRVNKFLGTKSLQVNNSNCSISFNSLNTTNIKDPWVSIKLGSYSNTTSEGSENGDFVSLAISTNGGISWSNEIEVSGLTQSKWSFNSGIGIAQSTYVGTDIISSFSPANSGFATTDGYGVIQLLGLPSVNDLRVRISIVNNQSNEIWAIDDVTLNGKKQASTIWDGNSWTNGTPNISKKAIIDGDYNTSVNGSITTCKCQINPDKNIVISTNTFLSSESDLVNSGNLTIESGGMLIQKDDFAANTGVATVKRDATIRKLDYVYWSSPINEFDLNILSPDTTSDLLWKWDPITPNPNGSLGFWVSAANDTMEKGKGYIVRGPSSFTNTPQNFTATFNNSALNNGIINHTISRGSVTLSTIGNFTSINGVPFSEIDDNWNLVGNPYPCAIDVNSFLEYNAIEHPLIEGSIKIWTHGTLPNSSVNPFYNSYLYNYTINDYITHNGTATITGPNGFNGFIASGQGFFVLMNEGDSASAPLTFNNSMRVNNLNSNTQFYKGGNSLMEVAENRHRIWLDLINASGAAVRTVIGYVNNATLQKDAMYDAYAKLDATQNLYSLINQELVCIQGRPLPFDANDSVPMGFLIAASGDYTIAIAALDGLFEGNQNVYLEDTLLHIIHDLKQGPYHFFSNAGQYNERFVLRYSSVVLENPENNINTTNVTVSVHSESIFINCSNQDLIESVVVFDVLGRRLYTKKDILNTNFTIDTLSPNKQPLVVKIYLKGGTSIVKKILF